jgi:phage terminase large subunit-like protein
MDDFFNFLDVSEKVIVPDERATLVEPKWLFSLCKDVLGMKDMCPQPHFDLCNIFEEAVGDCNFDGPAQQLIMVGVPRGTFKTTIATEGLSLGVLARNPNARILLDSFRHDVSKERLVAATGHITNNTNFHRLYGDDWKPGFREAPWSDSRITIAKRTKILKEPSIDTSGVDRSKTGSHYDLIIADDLVTDTNINTAKSRQKVYDHIMDLLPILEPGGTLILIFTRWHSDDAYGKIIRVDEDRVRDGKPPFFKKLIRSCFDGPNGLYFPSRQNFEWLCNKREQLKERKFSCQYLNNPIADSDRTFKMEYLQEVPFQFYISDNQGVVRTDDGQYPVYTTMAWDTAGSKATVRSDYHGLTIVGTDNFSRWWIPVAEGIKGTPTEVVNRVVAHILTYRPQALLIEAIGSYAHWADHILSRLQPLGISINIEEISPKGQSKESRIEQLEPLWSAKRIFLQRGLHELINQLDSFTPTSLPDHDDIIDSMAMHLGFTRPGDAVIRSNGPVNTLDQEWVKRRLRLQNEDPRTVWSRGTKWAT